jgi:hypothetical protein
VTDVRAPAVAGRFYPGEAAALEAEVARLLGAPSRTPRKHLGVVAPHAGYVYSGGVAGRVFADTEVPARVVVLAPNHTGRGRRGAVWARGALALPGCAVPVDEALCARLLGGLLEDDREAHRFEHALEVELPLLRARRADVRVTPIVLGGLYEAECVEVGEALAKAVTELGEDVLVVASSDMSHYLSDEETRAIDRRALEPLLALDAVGLYRRVRDEGITMCGVVPATVMLAYARARGARAAELLAYATSGDAFGERDRVVGYAGVVVD